MLDLGGQPLVEAVHRERGCPQHGIAKLAHMTQSGVPPRSGLGVELRNGRRALLALDLNIGVVGGGRLELLQGILVGHRPVSLGGRQGARMPARAGYFFFSLSSSVCVCVTGGPPREDWNVNVAV